MSGKTLVILTSDSCTHCLRFKHQKRPSGYSSMDELIIKLKNSYPNLDIKKANIDNSGNYNLSGIPIELYNLTNSWYPSFYLFDSNKFNSGIMDGGLVMGGYISGNNIVLDGTKRSTDPDLIYNWLIQNLNNNNNIYNTMPLFAQYEQRL